MKILTKGSLVFGLAMIASQVSATVTESSIISKANDRLETAGNLIADSGTTSAFSMLRGNFPDKDTEGAPDCAAGTADSGEGMACIENNIVKVASVGTPALGQSVAGQKWFTTAIKELEKKRTGTDAEKVVFSLKDKSGKVFTYVVWGKNALLGDRKNNQPDPEKFMCFIRFDNAKGKESINLIGDEAAKPAEQQPQGKKKTK
ncbi:MAG: hypothetical protein NTX76_00240 [Alphaproteobacteria bacterium]|nr:hypothetical protein [Alphaproteobacteria bacterium]